MALSRFEQCGIHDVVRTDCVVCSIRVRNTIAFHLEPTCSCFRAGLRLRLNCAFLQPNMSRAWPSRFAFPLWLHLSSFELSPLMTMRFRVLGRCLFVTQEWERGQRPQMDARARPECRGREVFGSSDQVVDLVSARSRRRGSRSEWLVDLDTSALQVGARCARGPFFRVFMCPSLCVLVCLYQGIRNLKSCLCIGVCLSVFVSVCLCPSVFL